MGSIQDRSSMSAPAGLAPDAHQAAAMLTSSRTDDTCGFTGTSVRRDEASPVSSAAPDEVGHPLADHHGRGVGVGADAVGHDRGVRDSYPCKSVHSAVLV